ncbi:hypothetical protein ADICYQ_0982 [Cyclobacterium qasimii M12-11B]|uniref:Uncharacterized protein n=1 Tax=Cyclobacterium qasimii M12-11B TaxID=641524 RepID=S7X359_9BACT|nr:hypothetical protein ADICYQ_0982 [Cyclobacterium qasimii M12-11B]
MNYVVELMKSVLINVELEGLDWETMQHFRSVVNSYESVDFEMIATSFKIPF